MRILNLYAGLGGNRKLWKNVAVTAIEKNADVAALYKKYYPSDIVIVSDALEYLETNYREFDFVWSSPPCQTHSFMRRHNPAAIPKIPDLSLYSQIFFLQSYFNGKYAVENVRPYYQPLLNPQIIDRHLFWANFIIHPLRIKKPANIVEDSTSIEGRELLAAWLGIDYDFSVSVSGNGHVEQALKNCIHPLLGDHVLKCAQASQPVLFE